MKKIEAFKTSDGKIFENNWEANAHEEGIFINNKKEDILRELRIKCTEGESTYGILLFIYKNIDNIRKVIDIFDNYGKYEKN